MQYQCLLKASFSVKLVSLIRSPDFTSSDILFAERSSWKILTYRHIKTLANFIVISSRFLFLLFQIAVSIYLLYEQLGVSALLAVLAMVLIMPLQFVLARAYATVQKHILVSWLSRCCKCMWYTVVSLWCLIKWYTSKDSILPSKIFEIV